MGRNGVVAPAPGDCHVAVASRNDGARRRAKSPNPFLCVIARSPEATLLTDRSNLRVGLRRSPEATLAADSPWRGAQRC